MVTIPTIDQISGTTVMNKMRSLIHAFINFANEVDTALTVTIPEYVDDALANYYTQNEINDMFDDYYTKTEVYTKSEVDALMSTKKDDFYPAVPLKFVTVSDNSVLSLDYVSGRLTLINNKLDVSADMVLRSMSVDSPLYKERGEVGQEVDALGISIDNDTIKINGDGELYANIQVQGSIWTSDSNADWAKYVSSNSVTEDIILKFYFLSDKQECICTTFIPKGSSINQGINMSYIGNIEYMYNYTISLSFILQNNSFSTATLDSQFVTYKGGVTESGGVLTLINEKSSYKIISRDIGLPSGGGGGALRVTLYHRI